MDENEIEVLNVHSMYGPSGHTIVVNCEFTIYISEYPSVENSVLKYSGGVQTPVFVNYDTAQLDISGTYSATNAGEYTAIFTPKAGYAFEDASESKSVTWGIYYIWKKYTVNTTSDTGYKAVLSENSSTSWTYHNNRVTLYNSYYFDAVGKFYTSGSSYTAKNSSGISSALASGRKYIGCSKSASLQEVTGSNSSQIYVNVYYSQMTTNYYYSCGTYIEDVHSTSSSTYPDNNKSGDYWYIKQ